MRSVVVLFALAGCGQLFKLEEVKLDPDAAVDAPPACTMADTYAAFDDAAEPCGAWGRLTTTNSAASTWPARSNGTLIITPAMGTAGAASCVARQVMPFGADGVWIQLVDIPTSPGYAVLSVDTATTFAAPKNATTKLSGSSAGIALYDHPTNMRFGNPVPWFPAQTRWWRIRPDNDARTIVAEVSGDFVGWTEVGRRDLPAPETASFVYVSVGAGRNDTTSEVGAATFDVLDVCP